MTLKNKVFPLNKYIQMISLISIEVAEAHEPNPIMGRH